MVVSSVNNENVEQGVSLWNRIKCVKNIYSWKSHLVIRNITLLTSCKPGRQHICSSGLCCVWLSSCLKSDVFKKSMHLDLKCEIKPSCNLVRCIIFSCLILSSLSLSGASGKGVIENLNKTVLLSLPRSLLLIEVESVLMGAAFLAMLIVRLSSSSSSLWRLLHSVL